MENTVTSFEKILFEIGIGIYHSASIHFENICDCDLFFDLLPDDDNIMCGVYEKELAYMMIIYDIKFLINDNHISYNYIGNDNFAVAIFKDGEVCIWKIL